MSTESIYGGWDTPRQDTNNLDRELQLLWSHLAAQHVGTPEFQPNSGMSQRKNEITELWKLFVLQQPRVICEIGCAQGGTLSSWCRLARHDATIIAIDRCVDDCRPRPGDPIHPVISARCEAPTSRGGGMHYLIHGVQQMIPINGWSHEPSTIARLTEVLAGRKIDFMFHDASHSRIMAMTDYELYRPFIADGGVMAFHDIQRSAHPDCNKSEFWEWAKYNADHSASYEYLGSKGDDSLGIGVLIF